jgi:hypothetical protein
VGIGNDLGEGLAGEGRAEIKILLVQHIGTGQAGSDIAGTAGAVTGAGVAAGERVLGVNARDGIGQQIGERALVEIADIVAANQGKRKAGPACTDELNGGELRSGGTIG